MNNIYIQCYKRGFGEIVMVEKAIDEFISTMYIEEVFKKRERLLGKLARFCTEVAYSHIYEPSSNRPLIGSSAEFIYPAQSLSDAKESTLVIPRGDGPHLRINALRHNYDEESVKGYLQVNFGNIEGQAYLGVQTSPEKSDTPSALREAISKIFETTDEGIE